MNSTHLKIRNTIGKYLSDNWSTTQISWENREFEAKYVNRFIGVTLLPVDSRQSVLGTVPLAGERRDYMLVIRIFVPIGNGTKELDEIADSLESLFNRVDLEIKGENVKIHFGVPMPPANYVASDGRFFQGNMNIPLWVQT